MQDSALLTNVIQLVVLAIPLFLILPMLKNLNRVTGQLASATDKFARSMGVAKASDWAQTGMKSQAKKRAAFAGSMASEKFQNSDRLGGIPGSLIKGIGSRRRDGAARAKQRELYVNARKQSREADVQSRSTQGLAQAAVGSSEASRLANAIAGSEDPRLKDFIASAQKEERDKQVGATINRWQISNTSPDEIAKELRKAMVEGTDHATATAAITRLSQMGAGGTEAVSTVVQSTQAAAPEMQTTVAAAINADSNYGSLVQKSGDVAKGEFDQSGNYKGNFHKLTTEQVSGLSDSAMKRYADEITSLKATNPTDQRVLDARAHFDKINASPGGYLAKIPDAKSAREFAKLQ